MGEKIKITDAMRRAAEKMVSYTAHRHPDGKTVQGDGLADIPLGEAEIAALLTGKTAVKNRGEKKVTVSEPHPLP